MQNINTSTLEVVDVVVFLWIGKETPEKKTAGHQQDGEK